MISPDTSRGNDGVEIPVLGSSEYDVSITSSYITINSSSYPMRLGSGSMTIYWRTNSNVSGSGSLSLNIHAFENTNGYYMDPDITNCNYSVTDLNYAGISLLKSVLTQTIPGAQNITCFIFFDTGKNEVTDFEFQLNYQPNHFGFDQNDPKMGIGAYSNDVTFDVDRVSSNSLLISGEFSGGASETAIGIVQLNWYTQPNISASGSLTLTNIRLLDHGNNIPTQARNATYRITSATATPVATETPTPTPTPTPVIKPANLKVDLELPSPATWGNTITHWIPNTREPMEAFRIKVTAGNQIDNGPVMGDFEFTGQYQQVNILTPVDAAYDNSETGNSNIHKNRGTAPIEILACNQNGSNPELLNRFELSGDDSTQYRYSQTTTNIGQNLKVGSDGYLYFDTGFSQLQYFTVQLGNGGTARPGDDIQLRFQLLNYPEHSDTVSEGDFLAVYDKNLLDAANQFIDQTINEDGTATGVVDWNGTDQIEIQHWRRFSDGNLVQNAVAYGWGCYDDVNQFNSEVVALNDLSQDVNSWYDYTFPPFKTEEVGSINYYVPIDPKHSVPGLTTYARFGDESQAMKVFKDKDGKALDADGGILDDDNSDQKNYSWRLTPVGSGDDCSGFVSRSTFLSGTNYKIVDFDENLSEEKEGTSILADPAASWEIGSAERNLIVPGDILVRANDHVAFVFYVDFNNNSRDLGNNYLQTVNIIHSTSGGLSNRVWRIKSEDTWENIGSNYLPRRLVIE